MKAKWLDRIAMLLPYLSLCTTEKQYLKAVKHLAIKSPSPWLSSNHGASMHTFTTHEKITCIVCIKIDKKRPFAVTAGMLAHEAVHVMQELFESIGEKQPGHETEAYAVENCTRVLIEEYERQAK